jgi:hypothetical protein
MTVPSVMSSGLHNPKLGAGLTVCQVPPANPALAGT